MTPIRIATLVRDHEAALAKAQARSADQADSQLAGRLREKVREVLGSAKEGRYFRPEQLFAEVTDLIARDFSLEQLAAALKWNRSQGYVAIRYNEEYEREEYAITNRGRAYDAGG